MQTSTTGNVMGTKAELMALTHSARAAFKEMETAEASVYRDVNLSNYRAWQFGRHLCDAKKRMEHGFFTDWRSATFPKLHERKARRCQELFTNNADRTELSVLNERSVREFVTKLEPDSLRKFRLGYFEKDKPEQPGNRKFPRLLHHLKIINELNRWKRRREVGHIEKDVEEERRDFRPEVYWFIAELFSDDVITFPDDSSVAVNLRGRKVLVLGEDYDQKQEGATP